MIIVRQISKNNVPLYLTKSKYNDLQPGLQNARTFNTIRDAKIAANYGLKLTLSNRWKEFEYLNIQLEKITIKSITTFEKDYTNEIH